MKQLAVAVALLVMVFGCTQKPAPVANDTAPADPATRTAIAVAYVAIPHMQVYDRPADDATIVTSYGFTEAISILENKGEWSMIRTFDGTGWVHAKDMMTAEESAKIDPLVPRFYQNPKNVPWNHPGELSYQAKVNTDGDVVDVKLTKNTTGSQAIANANADALKEAKFYPMVDKGSRKTFTYEYKIYY